MGLEWEDHEDEVPFPSYDVSLSLMTQAVITWMRFPIINTLYSPFSYYTLQKRGSYSKSKELKINHINYLEFYMGYLSLFLIYLSIQSFIDISVDSGYLFESVDCNPIVWCLFVTQIAPALGIRSSFGLVLMFLYSYVPSFCFSLYL